MKRDLLIAIALLTAGGGILPSSSVLAKDKDKDKDQPRESAQQLAAKLELLPACKPGTEVTYSNVLEGIFFKAKYDKDGRIDPEWCEYDKNDETVCKHFFRPGLSIDRETLISLLTEPKIYLKAPDDTDKHRMRRTASMSLLILGKIVQYGSFYSPMGGTPMAVGGDNVANAINDIKDKVDDPLNDQKKEQDDLKKAETDAKAWQGMFTNFLKCQSEGEAPYKIKEGEAIRDDLNDLLVIVSSKPELKKVFDPTVKSTVLSSSGLMAQLSEVIGSPFLYPPDVGEYDGPFTAKQLASWDIPQNPDVHDTATNPNLK